MNGTELSIWFSTPLVIIYSVVGSVILILLLSLWTHHLDQKAKLKFDVNREIRDTYINNGISLIMSSLSYYGKLSFLTIDKINREILLLKKRGQLEQLPLKLKEIREIEPIHDLISFDYKLAYASFPKLLPFGIQVYNAILYAFYMFSSYVVELTDSDRLSPILEEKEDHNWIIASANQIQFVAMYLEEKLLYLENYVREKQFKNFDNFNRITNDKEVIEICKELKELHSILRDHISASPEQKKEKRTNERLQDFIQNHPTKFDKVLQKLNES